MASKVTTDVDGNVVETSAEGVRVSTQFSHAIKNYGDGPEASIHISELLDADADEGAVQSTIKRNFAIAKAHVYEQLGVPTEVDSTTSVVVGLLDKKLGVVEVDGKAVDRPARRQATAAPRRAASSAPARKPAGRPNQAQIDAAWNDYLDNPDAWFDNRPKKESGDYKPNAADFKSKKDGFDGGGFALWIDSASDSVKAALNDDEDF